MKWLAAPFVSINETDQQRRISDARVKFFQNTKILRDKTRFKNQVLRRISGDGQLGRQNQFRAGISKTLVRANDFLKIAAQIPYGRINLSKTDLHAAQSQIMRNAVRSNHLFLAFDSNGGFYVSSPSLGQLVKHCESKLDQVTVARHEREAV